MSEWISVIAALGGAAIGGIISYVATLVTLAREEKSEKRAIVLSKLEETHQVVRTIRQTYKEGYSTLLPNLMAGIELPEKQSPPLEIDRLAMLVDIYFPELSPASAILEEARLRYGDILTESITRNIGGSRSGKEIAEDLMKCYNELDKACAEFLKVIAKAARKRVKI